MATVDFTKPVTSDDRAAVLAYIRDAINSQARMFEGDTLVSLPVNTVRYNAGNTRFEIWNGSSWGALNIAGQGSFLPLAGGTLTSYLVFNGATAIPVNYTQSNGTVASPSEKALIVGAYAGDGSPRAGIYQVNEFTDNHAHYLRLKTTSTTDPTPTVRMTVGGRGDVALGSLKPSNWGTQGPALQLWNNSGYGSLSFFQQGGSGVGNDCWIASNAYFDGSTWRRAHTGFASAVSFYGGAVRLQTAGSAATDSTFAFTERAIFSVNGGLELINTDQGVHGLKVVGPVGGVNGYYAGVFHQGNAQNYGKVLLLDTYGGGGDGPQIHFRHQGIIDWGFGVQYSDGTHMALYSGGSSGQFGTEVFRFQTDGAFVAAGNVVAGGSGQSITSFEAITATNGTPKVTLHKANNTAIELRLNSSNVFEVGNYSWSPGRFTVDGSGNIVYPGSLNGGGLLTIRGDNPTITLSDTDGNTAYVHVNSSTFYVLRGGNNANYGEWSAVGSGWWPFQVNLTNNDASVGGNFTAAYNVTAYSDERLKKDFAPVILTLEQMLTLAPESFTRIDTAEEFRQIGVRAQALQKILPEAVRENDTGFLSANYGAAAMVIALNLVREVAALKARL